VCGREGASYIDHGVGDDPRAEPVFVLDRGYARASLLKHLRALNLPFSIRGRSHTIVRVGDERLSALSIGILALSLQWFVNLARDELARLLAGFERGRPAVEIAR
jgi:hypothetical protein